MPVKTLQTPTTPQKPEDVQNGTFPPSSQPTNMEVVAFIAPKSDLLDISIAGSDFFEVTGGTVFDLILEKSPFVLANGQAVFDWEEEFPRSFDGTTPVSVFQDQRVHITVSAGGSADGVTPGAVTGTLVISGRTTSFSVALNGFFLGVDEKTPFGAKYQSLGGEAFFGAVITNAHPAPVLSGTIQEFANGALWDTGDSVFYLSRAIYDKWISPSVQLGIFAPSEAFNLGTPTEDTLATAGGGEVLRFRNGVIIADAELQSASIVLDASVANSEFVYIRDQIVINADLNTYLNAQGGGASGTVRLIARQIRHDGATPLLLTARNVVIVADEYDSSGGIISTTGRAGGVGASGLTGSPGEATSTGIGNLPGGPGSPGGVGAAGSAALSVRLICQRIVSAHVVANGATGGAGGTGGQGGPGAAGRIKHGLDPETIEGTSGGNGGPGGRGGQGGPGGHALAVFMSASAAPVLEVSGGPGGAGGPGGRRGVKGQFSPDDNGKPGPAGASGPSGAAGTATRLPVDPDTYWGTVQAELGARAAEWAAHRLAVGEYFYRAYNPAVSSRSGSLIMALQEFDAVLRLDPGNADAARLRNQILLNQNVLGLPVDLDLIPNFSGYIAAFVGFDSLLFGTFNAGISELLAATELGALEESVDLQLTEIQNTVADTTDDLQGAKLARATADEEVTQADARLTEVNGEIQAALADMNNHEFSLGDAIGVVGEIGGAVLAVAAAIPSGGTSLAALVPDVLALTESVSENAGPLVDSLFGMDQDAIDSITDAYKQVNQDGDEVIGNSKVVTSFGDLIGKLGAGSTADNSQYVALLQKGVDLLHAKYLAEKRLAQADQAVMAEAAKLDRAKALQAETGEVLSHLSTDQKIINAAGLRAIRNAQMHVDILLSLAFRAQRSVEIYTLKSEAKNLFLDAGYVHPDVDRDFTEGRMGGNPGQNRLALIAAYTDSWAKLLQPADMQKDYLDYFSANPPQHDIRRLSFTDPEILQRTRDTHNLSFEFALTDLAADHFEAKVQGVFVAFVGAKSVSNGFSCEVRHADRYVQKQKASPENPGGVAVQLLEQHFETRQASTSRLNLSPADFDSDPITGPTAIPFWGRGAAGLWSVSITDDEFQVEKIDLSNLSEIQVWVGHQFIV